MVKEKLYICRECGYVFPKELSELIDNKVQVYCEMCGTPFSLEGVTFKQPTIKPLRSSVPKYSSYLITDKSKKKLSKAIQKLNKFAYLPILIFSGIYLGFIFLILIDPNIQWLRFLIDHLLFGISGILIAIYDINYISPRIENEDYDDIILDAFCFGILGCIIYGVGVILLIKGILIVIYGIIKPSGKTHKVYRFGLKLKNSLNAFSAKAGVIIIFFVLYGSLIGIIDIQFILSFIGFVGQSLSTLEFWLGTTIMIIIIIGICLIPILILIIDARRKRKLREKDIFTFKDAFGTFVLGLFGTIFFAIGIFILLKGILMFFLVAGKPSDFETTEKVMETKRAEYPQRKIVSEERLVSQESEKQKESLEVKEIPKEEPLQVEELTEEMQVKGEKEVTVVKPVIKQKESKEKELRLHESLLPVKDEKDKKVVKEYFSKIFTVLAKDIKNQIRDLKIPKNEKKEILKELAFLTEQEQKRYLGALAELYRDLPRKLITRIRKLPNVEPQHYEKIIEQLKYMDSEEQFEFIQFLEKNA